MRGLGSAWTNAARTSACALVVLVHANMIVRADVESWWPIGIACVPLYGLAVPLFLMLSGYTAARPDSATGSFNTTWLMRKLRQLALPFIFWNVITLLISHDDLDGGIDTLIYALTGSWHLYFLFVLMQLLVVRWAFERALGPKWPAWMLGAGILSSLLCYGCSDALLWTQPPDGGWLEAMTRRLFPVWFVFYAAGAWLRASRASLRFPSRRMGWLAAITAISYLCYLAGLMTEARLLGNTPRLQLMTTGLPFQLFGSMFVLALLMWLQDQKRFQRAMLALAAPSRYTYGIYLSHLPIMIILIDALSYAAIPTANWIAVPAIAVAVWAIAQSCVILSRRGPSVLRQIAFGGARRG